MDGMQLNQQYVPTGSEARLMPSPHEKEKRLLINAWVNLAGDQIRPSLSRAKPTRVEHMPITSVESGMLLVALQHPSRVSQIKCSLLVIELLRNMMSYLPRQIQTVE
jgi:hypothetical protein